MMRLRDRTAHGRLSARIAVGVGVLVVLGVGVLSLAIPTEPLIPLFLLRGGRREIIVNCTSDCADTRMTVGAYSTLLRKGAHFFWVSPAATRAVFERGSERIVCPIAAEGHEDVYIGVQCDPLRISVR